MIVNFSALTRLLVLSVVLVIPFLFRYKTFDQKNGKSCIRNILVHSPADGCVHLTFQKGLQSSDRIYWGNVVTKYWVLEQKKVSFLKYFHQPESYQLRDASCFQNWLILSVTCILKISKNPASGKGDEAESSSGKSNNVGGGCDAICSSSFVCRGWRLSWAPALPPERAPGVPRPHLWPSSLEKF